MFEPKNLPTVVCESTIIPGVKFGFSHNKERISPASPNIDPIHIHGYAEIFFDIRSDVSFLVDNKLYPLSHGDIIISPPGVTHVCIFESDTVHEHACLWIDADRYSPILDFIYREDFSPHISLGVDECERVYRLLTELELAMNDPALELTRASAMLGILSSLSVARGVPPEQTHLPHAMQLIVDDIHTNCAQIKSVNDIIARHFISGATLNRYFKKYIHLSPREYLESQKLALATKLLLSGESVTECCMKAGFSDCSHFICLFKRKFGTTPFKYKQRSRHIW